MPFVSSLKALADLPSERAISGSFRAPKSRMITPAMISSSGTPRLPTVILLSPPASRSYVSRGTLHPFAGLFHRYPQGGGPRPEGASPVLDPGVDHRGGDAEPTHVANHPDQYQHEQHQSDGDHDPGRQVRHHVPTVVGMWSR